MDGGGNLRTATAPETLFTDRRFREIGIWVDGVAATCEMAPAASKAPLITAPSRTTALITVATILFIRSPTNTSNVLVC